jgi:hypothetical protein
VVLAFSARLYYRSTLYQPVSLDKDAILIRCGAVAAYTRKGLRDHWIEFNNVEKGILLG